MKEVKDHYYQKAKKEGYAARSAFKLEEIDSKHQLLKRGQQVLDLGCSPGSWLQYTSAKIGAHGKLTGLDLKPVTGKLPDWVEVIQADIFEFSFAAFPSFDVILSDMAPNTTGIRTVDADRSYALCQQVLEIAKHHLQPQGTLLVKAFQGGPFEQLRKEFQQTFQQVKICKPKSSRQESVEIFLLGKVLKGEDTQRQN
ncbi:RlmE family RNA methyltransferase [Deltaproteobacteria bacterium TL4]